MDAENRCIIGMKRCAKIGSVSTKADIRSRVIQRMEVQADRHLIDELTEGLSHLRAEATSGDFERSEKIAARLSEIISEHGDIVEDKDGLFQQIDHYRLVATQASLDAMLEDALVAARNVDTTQLSRILGLAEQRIVELAALGADREFQTHLAQQLALIRTAAHSVGDDQVQHNGATQGGATQGSGTQGSGTQGGGRRRAKRSTKGTVVATIAGNSYTCVDWSARGLLVGGYDGDVQINGRLRVRVEVPGFRGGGQLSGRVVRYDAESKSLALDFGDVSRVMLLLIKALEDAEADADQG